MVQLSPFMGILMGNSRQNGAPLLAALAGESGEGVGVWMEGWGPLPMEFPLDLWLPQCCNSKKTFGELS